MPRLTDLIPDPDVLLALEPAELAPYVLEAARGMRQNGMVQLGSLFYGIFAGDQYAHTNPNPYDANKRRQIEVAVTEAWSWLQANQLLIPDPSQGGMTVQMCLSRRAEALTTHQQFKSFATAALFPKKLLHPAIADDVWGHLIRGAYPDAVFRAFRGVEEAVRQAGGYTDTDIGVELIRKAFDPDKGPLTKPSDPLPERQALAHLFAGAIGSYKNPHSHRTVTISEPAEAQEIVLLASHLLRIVDSRVPD